jgi:hypothetical protein
MGWESDYNEEHKTCHAEPSAFFLCSEEDTLPKPWWQYVTSWIGLNGFTIGFNVGFLWKRR